MTEAAITLRLAGQSEPFTWTGADILRLERKETPGHGGLPLGQAVVKCFLVTFDPGEAELTSAFLDGAELSVRLKTGEEWQPLGVGTVTDAAFDDRGLCTLTAEDALGVKFGGTFHDSASAYPRTLKNLVETLCAAAGVTLLTQSFPNDSLRLASKPDWRDGVTLLEALRDAAFLAGGFVRTDGEGRLEIVPCGGETAVQAENVLFRVCAGGTPFALNTVLYRFAGDSEYTRFSADASLRDTPANSCRAEGNPLVTAANLRPLVSSLRGAGGESGFVRWVPSFVPLAGDRLCFCGRDGAEHAFPITSQTLTLDKNGLKCVSAASFPSAASCADVNARTGVFNSDGTLCFEAIGDAPLKVMALDRAYIGSLTAEEITALGLTARLIEAVKLRAQGIAADAVETDALTAAAAEILSASVRRLDAGTVTSDALVSAAAELLALKTGSLTAEDLSTDRLAAALARFQVLTAGTADFDRATVTHLVANALNLSYGAGDQVFINNLAASYASLVKADVNELTVKAADGRYYRLIADANGVRTEAVEPSQEDIRRGQTASGPIIESSLTVSDLSASDIRGVYALINRLDAARLDVDTLLARRAFIEKLNTVDITSNDFLRLSIGGLREDVDAVRSEADENGPLLNNLKNWLVFDEDGLRQGKQGSAFSTLINAGGYHIRREGSVEDVGAFDKNGLRACGVTLGGIRAGRTPSGGWIWTEE